MASSTQQAAVLHMALKWMHMPLPKSVVFLLLVAWSTSLENLKCLRHRSLQRRFMATLFLQLILSNCAGLQTCWIVTLLDCIPTMTMIQIT